MARDQLTLIGILPFVVAIVGFGYLAVGSAIFLFSVTFVGGFAVWVLTTYRTDIDPHKILAPYLLTVILFIGHVYEEYVSHIEVALGGIMHIDLTQGDFLTVAAFAAPIVWLVGALLILYGFRIEYFLVIVFLFGMMFGESSHFAFPFREKRQLPLRRRHVHLSVARCRWLVHVPHYFARGEMWTGASLWTGAGELGSLLEPHQ